MQKQHCMAYRPYATEWTERIRLLVAEGTMASHTAGTSNTRSR